MAATSLLEQWGAFYEFVNQCIEGSDDTPDEVASINSGQALRVNFGHLSKTQLCFESTDELRKKLANYGLKLLDEPDKNGFVVALR